MLLVDSTPWLGCRFRGGVLDVFGNVLGWSSPHIFDTYIISYIPMHRVWQAWVCMYHLQVFNECYHFGSSKLEPK